MNIFKYGDKPDWELTKNQLFEKYQPLVYHFSEKLSHYRAVWRLGGFEDIQQECALQLWRAIQVYDPNKRNSKTGRPYTLSTLAYRMIPQHVYAAAYKKGLIAISPHSSCRKKFKRWEHALKVCQLDDSSPFDDAAEQREYVKDEASCLKEMMDRLDRRSRTLLKKRFGLNRSRKGQIRKVLGKYLGVSRQSVANLEKKALKKLKQQIQMYKPSLAQAYSLE